MRMKKIYQNGFTLIELMIVMLVMSVLALALMNFVAGWLQLSSEAQAQANLTSTAQLALEKATNDIMLSGSVDSPNRWPDPNGPNGNQYGWTANSQTLILAKVAINSSGQPIYTDNSDYVTLKDDEIYFLSGTTLYRRTLASGEPSDIAVTTCPQSDATASCPPDNIVATGVTNWSVSYYGINGDTVSPTDARSIQLSITLSAQYGSKPITASYTTRMVFRNE